MVDHSILIFMTNSINNIMVGTKLALSLKNIFLDAKNNLQNKKLSIPHVSTYSMSGSEGLDQWVGVRENLQDTTLPFVHQIFGGFSKFSRTSQSNSEKFTWATHRIPLKMCFRHGLTILKWGYMPDNIQYTQTK